MPNVRRLYPERQNGDDEYELFQNAARVAAILPDNGRDAIKVLELARKWLEEYIAEG